MSDPSPRRRRRERTAFHYKVDEDLRPEHREPYLALLRDPHMRIDDAHAWLTARGYVLSRSAVARHRRRLLARDAAQADGLRHAEMFAMLAGRPGAPDFAAGARVQLEHLVFRHVLALDERPGTRDAAAAAAHGIARRLDPDALLEVSKLIAALVELTRLRLAAGQPAKPAAHTNSGEPTPARTDAELAQRINDILAGKP